MSEPITNPYRGARRAHETTKEFSFRLAKELAYDDGTAAVLAALESNEAVNAGAMRIWEDVDGPLGSASFLPPNQKHTIIHNRLRSAAVLSAVVAVLKGEA